MVKHLAARLVRQLDARLVCRSVGRSMAKCEKTKIDTFNSFFDAVDANNLPSFEELIKQGILVDNYIDNRYYLGMQAYQKMRVFFFQ